MFLLYRKRVLLTGILGRQVYRDGRRCIDYTQLPEWAASQRKRASDWKVH
jgi:hypothetical protein